LALIDPHYYDLRDSDHPPRDSSGDQTPVEGIAIYLLLDSSLSMEEPVNVTTEEGYRKNVTRLEMLKEVTKRFVEGDKTLGLKGRPNDLIGVVTFSRSAQVLTPLTLDHNVVLRELNGLKVNRDQSQLGTSLGYAIFKTANLIAATRNFGGEIVEKGKPSYDIKSSVILLVTDGFQETNPEDVNNHLRSIELPDAIEFAKEQGIRIYIVNIDPSISAEKYADHRKLFQLLTESTGGKFFFSEGSRNLSQIYAEIDRLEKSLLPAQSQSDKERMPHLYQRISLYPIFIAIGLLLLVCSVILETTFLRIYP
jgi:Ca-activated chloride channel family protein